MLTVRVSREMNLRVEIDSLSSLGSHFCPGAFFLRSQGSATHKVQLVVLDYMRFSIDQLL